jgi:hypothetical protein
MLSVYPSSLDFGQLGRAGNQGEVLVYDIEYYALLAGLSA